MPFRLIIPETVELAVSAKAPKTGGGESEIHFGVTVRYLDVAGRKELWERVRDGEIDDDGLLSEQVTGWRDVQDEAGAALAFSAEALARLANVPFARAALLDAVIGELRDGTSARGN